MVEQQSVELVRMSGYARRFVSKVIAALLCSGSLAWMVYRLMLLDAAQGKAAYIADQAAYFEEALSPPDVGVALVYVIMIGLFLMLYEVISLGIYLLIRQLGR